jgi:hypothetical protein
MGQSASVGQGTVGADELKVTGNGSSGQVLSSDGDGTFSWVTDSEEYLPLAGGTMSGAIDLNSQNITNGGAIAGTFTGGLTGNVTGDVTGNVSGTAPAGSLTGTELKSTVVTSSLTSVGALTALTGGTGDFNWDSNTLVVDSSESRVGIGTSAPDQLLHIEGSDPKLQIERTSPAQKWYFRVDSGQNLVIYDDTASTESVKIENATPSGTLYLKSDGNVGIGTTSPASPLHINTGTNNNLEFEEVSSELRISALNDARSVNVPLQFAASEFNFLTGNVGIGTDSPSYGLDVLYGTKETKLQVRNGGIYTHTQHNGGTPAFHIVDSDSDASRCALNVQSNAGSTNILYCQADGNVGIGTTSPARPLTVSSDGEVKALFENTSTTGGQYAYIDVESNATSTAKAYLRLITPDGTSTIHSEGTATAVTLKDGKVGIGIAVPTQKLHVFDDSTLTVLNLTNDHESHPQGIQLGFSSASPNNNTQEAFKFSDNVNNRCIIWSNGDIDNTGNSYSAFSDERIKNSITDASSQWDDIKAIKVRKFKKNSDVLQYGEDAPIHIGVVAQEVESAGMSGLVFEHPADEIEIANNEDISEGDMVKSVKYSILYMKAIKALQEAMTKIETLESRVTALENA